MSSCTIYDAPPPSEIATMSPESLALVEQYQQEALKQEQIPIETTHVLHAGLYLRTIMLPKDTVLSGALIKIPTVLIVSGHVTVFVGDEGTVEIQGYHVLQAHAGRKQIFRAHSDTYMTMCFATSASTVLEAEDEFTDEGNLLLSRRE